jgi:transketolase
VTVEDHRPEGGLGEAVLGALADADLHPAVTRLAVRSMPGSATPEEQLAEAAIDASAIAAAARRLVIGTAPIQSGLATRPFTSRS